VRAHGVLAAHFRVRGRRLQVRFRRYRFSPTGELGYSGIRGAEGLDTGSYKHSLLLIL
jgi:hypothetical protein